MTPPPWAAVRPHQLALAANPAVERFGVVAYAGVPLRAADGEPIGTWCVDRLDPHAVWLAIVDASDQTLHTAAARAAEPEAAALPPDVPLAAPLPPAQVGGISALTWHGTAADGDRPL